MITQPTLLLNEVKCRANITAMVDKARRHGVVLRPHFKTHQSLAVGRWFEEAGVDRITVSSLEMATYFAAEWDNITVAFPCNIREIDTINELAERITLNVLIESADVAHGLQQQLKHPIGFFIKIDVGYHRTGVASEDTRLIDKIIAATAANDLLRFKGFLAHAGHTYRCRTSEAIRVIHQQARTTLVGLKARYQATHPTLIASLGDTPSCSVADDFREIDELRPGNFVFYDLMQHQIGSNRINQIAVAMACPVVAVHPARCELVIYGGAAHFSKDRLETEEGTIFGSVVEDTPTGWGSAIPGMHVKRLSQEHGIVAVPEERLSQYRVGDLLTILPVHACLTANLMKGYRLTDGASISRL